MSNLRFAAKVLIRQRQRIPRVITSVARLISTSAPKPNFGNHELRIPTETMHIESTQLLTETPPSKVGGDEEGKSNQSDNANVTSDNTNVSVPPKTSVVKDEMPAMTIVDINSGYGRMDFEERMDHMDLVDRLNDGKLPTNMSSAPMMPLVREVPTVVSIDAYSDEMMYEDKPEEEELPESSPIISNAEPAADTSSATKSTATTTNSTSVVGGGSDLVPISNEVVQATEEPVTTTTTTMQPEANVDATVKAVAAYELAAQSTCTTTTSTTPFDDGVCIAPIDIDAFPKEDEEKNHGTVDIDAFGDEKRRKLPPIPKVRNNVFEFKGIKIIMPKRMLRDETYRYRLDPKDKDKPDDMQICTFEK